MVPVTQELSDSVITGQFPGHMTVVRKFTPNCTAGNRMLNLDDRRTAFEYYHVFLDLARHHWNNIIP